MKNKLYLLLIFALIFSALNIFTIFANQSNVESNYTSGYFEVALEDSGSYAGYDGNAVIVGCDSSCTSAEIPSVITNGAKNYLVTTIQHDVFSGCTNLTYVYIPYSVESIEADSLFMGCDNLTDIEVSNDNEYYYSADGVIYYSYTDLNNVYPLLVCCAPGKSGSFTIPAGTDRIGAYAFNYCTKITSISMDNLLTRIDSEAFKGCTNLENIYLSAGLTYIESSAFNYSPALKEITIPANVTGELDNYSFEGCASLTNIYVSSENTSYSSVDGILYNNDGTELIRCPEGKTSVYIPNGVKKINEGAFFNCDLLKSITIPESVVEIDEFSFEGCYSLESVYCVPNSAADNSSLYFDSYNFSFAYTDSGSITVLLNGNELSFNVEPYIENGVTMVPMRAIFEALGAEVDYDSETKTITAVKGGTTIILTIGNTSAYKNGESVVLQNAAKIVDGSTMVPLRFISESLGAAVDWDGDTKTIIITSN